MTPDGHVAAQLGIRAAGAVITLVPIIVVFIVLQRYFVRGLTEGATKGY